jgi:hypothetical protein
MFQQKNPGSFHFQGLRFFSVIPGFIRPFVSPNFTGVSKIDFQNMTTS